MNIEAPQSVYGLAAIVAVQLLIQLGSGWHQWLSTRRSTSRSKTIRDDVGEMKHHVVNDHGNRNLRHDIDRLLELGEGFATGLARLDGKFDALEHRVDEFTRPVVVTSPGIVRPAPRTGW